MTDIVSNFVELYQALIDKSPHLAVHNFRCENSDYSDQLIDSKNAYVCFNGDGVYDCYYTWDSRWIKNCADASFSNNCELCYEIIDCEKCYNGSFLQDCEGCTDCQYCFDCFSCSNCFGCVGLRKAEFHIFNTQYSKESYARKLPEVRKWPDEKIRKEMEKLKLKHPHVAMHIRQSENCLGDYIFESKNCFSCSKIHRTEDCCYISSSKNLRDCVDCDMTHRSELTYEAIEDNQNYNSNFLYWCADLRNSEYMMYCFNCDDCFGCFNLKRKKYHILNKPYEKEKYHTLVSAIKKSLQDKNRYMNFLPDIIRR